MDIILLEDVKTIGKKGDLVKINDGYARNYIIPKKLGMEATNKNLNDYKLKKAHEAKLAAELLASCQKLSEEMKEKKVVLKMKVGEGGRTFGSISSKEVAIAMKEQLGYEVDKKKLQLKDPIKTLGMHIVAVKLHPKVTSEIKVQVVEN